MDKDLRSYWDEFLIFLFLSYWILGLLTLFKVYIKYMTGYIFLVVLGATVFWVLMPMFVLIFIFGNGWKWLFDEEDDEY